MGFFFPPSVQNLLSQSNFVAGKVILRAELVFDDFENKCFILNRSYELMRSYTVDVGYGCETCVIIR